MGGDATDAAPSAALAKGRKMTKATGGAGRPAERVAVVVVGGGTARTGARRSRRTQKKKKKKQKWPT